MATQRLGTVGWMDLTVPDATAVRDFYAAVTGWSATAMSMGEYDDFCMVPSAGGDPVAGICHARGGNANLPAVWLPYITVANLDASMQACREKGGEVVAGPKDYGAHGRWCVIRDPAGAHAALFQQAEQPAEMQPSQS